MDGQNQHQVDHLYLLIDGLIPNSMYKFRVRGHNEAGLGSLGPASNTLRTSIDEPDQVKTVTASNITDDSLELQWATPKTHGIIISGYQIKYKTVKEQNWTVWPESIPAPLNATVNNLVLKGLNPGTKYMVQVNTETSVGQNEGIIVRDGFNTTGKKRRRSSFRRNSSSEGTPRASNGGSSSLKSSSKRSILGGSNKSRHKLLNKSSSNSGKSVSKRRLSKSKTHHAKRSPSNGSSKSKRDLLKSKSHPGKLPERSTSAINTKMTFMSNFSLSMKKKKKNGIPNAVKKQMASRAAAKTNRMKKKDKKTDIDGNDDIV